MDTRFYLYFARQEDAEQAAETLRPDNFTVTVRFAADDDTWLALVNRDLTDDEFQIAANETMPKLAASLGGEFDGYERTVSRDYPRA